MNLFELRGKFGGAAFVSCAKVQVEKALERGRVARRALQHIFEKVRGLLREAVAREEVHIRERLRDVLLRFFIERLFDDGGRRYGNRLLVFVNSWRWF